MEVDSKINLNKIIIKINLGISYKLLSLAKQLTMRNLILITFGIAILSMLFSCSVSRPIYQYQKQVRVIEVMDKTKQSITLKCIEMNRIDTSISKLNWKGLGASPDIRKGTWLTVRYNQNKRGEWVDADITVNY